MAKKFDNKQYFQTQLEKACKGTVITPRELLRELINSGYKNLYSGGILYDELEVTVADLIDSKEVTGANNPKNGKASNTVEVEEFEIADEDESDDEDDD